MLFLAFVGVVIMSARRCVLAGTAIETPGGPRLVETLRVGDAVLSVAGDGQRVEGVVVSVRRSVALRWKRVFLDGGATLDVTPPHPVATAAGWRAAGALAAGDVVRGAAGLTKVARVEDRVGLATVHDLSVEPGETFLAEGVLVHNKSTSKRPPDIMAIGTLRSMIGAQAAYAQMNGGHYDRIECLAQPAACGLRQAPSFLDPSFLQGERQGYRFDLRLGAKPPPGARGIVSPTSVTSYAYLAVPVKSLFSSYQYRGFCGDDTGTICFTMDGTAPPVADGHCAPSCQQLR